jgi:ATP synthase protein I
MSDLDNLKTRLKIAKSKLQKNKSENTDKKGIFLGNAFKLGTELIAAVIVGTIIGFILDNWFGTKPILIIIFFFFGAATGILNVIKAAKKMQKDMK